MLNAVVSFLWVKDQNVLCRTVKNNELQVSDLDLYVQFGKVDYWDILAHDSGTNSCDESIF